MGQVIKLGYEPRKGQLLYHDRVARFCVLVAHRRWGKTVAVVNDLIKKVVQSDRFMATGAYLAPLRNQAKRIAWPLLKHYCRRIPGYDKNESELIVTLPPDKRIIVAGSDNADALRGWGLVDAKLDETAQIDPTVWRQVIRPALADAKGSATFIGTPKGRLNLFHDLYEEAKDLEDWCRMMFTVDDSGVIDHDELMALKREMSGPEYEQEFYCSFNAAVTGSYYGKEMALADAQGRITRLSHDPRFPVFAALDLGWSDLTVVWLFQLVGNQLQLLEANAYSHTSLPEVVKDITKDRGWLVEGWLAPHDIKVTELGTGKSRLEVLWSLGCDVTVVPDIGIEDGREAVRDLLPRCWFDREGCRTGVEALVQYKTEYDAVLRVYSKRAVHNWASHYADAFRYLAVGVDDLAEWVRGLAQRSGKAYRGVI